jgi:outer membrane biosynthesis protein TonB
MASVIRYSIPPYPKSSARADSCGLVVADLHVDGTGRVVLARVNRAPDRRIAEVTEATLRDWLFQPATIGGKPHPVRTRVFLYFRLEAQRGFVLIPGLNDVR